MSTVVAVAPVDRDRSATFRSALRWVLVLAGLAFLVLLVTGIWLTFWYRPSASLSWFGSTSDGPVRGVEAVRDVHKIAARFFLALGLAATVMAVVLAVQMRKVLAAIAGALLFLFALGASVSGALLPWTQLALRRVTVGTNYSGFWKISSDENRYVLLGSHEISVHTFIKWFWVHIAVLPIALVVLAVLVLLTTRRRPAPVPSGSPQSPAQSTL